jgi:hypothetical protein
LYFGFLWGFASEASYTAEKSVDTKDRAYSAGQTASITETARLIDTSSFSYTIYLPIVTRYINPKKGVGVKAPPACDDVNSLRASWYSNWVPWPDSTCNTEDLDRFVPRILNGDYMQYLADAVENATPPEGSGWIIGFAEPNRPEQGNMTPQQGAIYWKQIETEANLHGIKLVSPAPVEADPEQSWLWAMVEAYRDQNCPIDRACKPQFDGIAWNIYGCTNHPACYNVEGMKDYLRQRRDAAARRGYNVPIWVVEFGGCLTENSSESDKIIMREMTAWFNQTSWIARYAWYSNRTSPTYQGEHDCVLLDEDGLLTELGQIYLGF